MYPRKLILPKKLKFSPIHAGAEGSQKTLKQTPNNLCKYTIPKSQKEWREIESRKKYGECAQKTMYCIVYVCTYNAKQKRIADLQYR